MRATTFILLAGVILTSAHAESQVYERDLPLDHEAIPYWKTTPTGVATRLVRDVAGGRRTLVFEEGGLSYLRSLLDALEVPVESQSLVFSKNSLQRTSISPQSPRAIYFNDDVSVGFVPGGDVIEIAGSDPLIGAVFYTLRRDPKSGPFFERPRICIACHRGAATLGVPGVYVSSVVTTRSGRPEFRLGSTVTDHRSPFEQRWGGWYVDGAPGGMRHLGNGVKSGPADASTRAMSALEQLLQRPDPSSYPTTGSDVVALMVLEHQTQWNNLVTRLRWESSIAQHEGRPSDTLAPRVSELVRYMLFVDEVPLPEPVDASSSFARSFQARGPFDAHGRSLRAFDLETRLFRYPLSYMIYSNAFDALPESLRNAVLRELYDAVREHRDLIEIVRETKEDLPAFWR